MARSLTGSRMCRSIRICRRIAGTVDRSWSRRLTCDRRQGLWPACTGCGSGGSISRGERCDRRAARWWRLGRSRCDRYPTPTPPPRGGGVGVGVRGVYHHGMVASVPAITLTPRAPFDARPILGYYGRSPLEPLDIVTDGAWRRAVRLGGQAVLFEVAANGTVDAPSLTV